MKKITLLVSILFTALSVSAQSGSSEAAIKKMWLEVYEAYNKGDYEKGFEVYTEKALEITPDGRIAVGKNSLRENWEEFMKIVDEKPTFKPDNLTVRMITPEVGILTWTSVDDIKINGQQMGGNTVNLAIAHRINGKWMIEADALVPVVPMPESPQTVKK